MELRYEVKARLKILRNAQTAPIVILHPAMMCPTNRSGDPLEAKRINRSGAVASNPKLHLWGL